MVLAQTTNPPSAASEPLSTTQAQGIYWPLPPPMQQRQRASTSLDELLTVAQLDAFRGMFKAMGVAISADFQDVEDEDFICSGPNRDPGLRRKLLEMTA